MDHLIVPSDFSPAAKNAMDYAIQLANQFESQITLIHCLGFTATADLWGIQLKMREEAKQELNKMKASSLEPLLSAVNMDVKVLNGTLQEELKQLSQRQSADLIIMGTEGASDLEALFWETNTVSTINSINLPILVIPENFVYRPVKEIAFFVDGWAIQNEVLVLLRRIATNHQGHIGVHHFVERSGVEGLEANFLSSLQGLNYSIHQSPDWQDIDLAIEVSLAQTEADLMCMIKRKRQGLSNWAHVSKTTRMAYHPSVPLLILYENGQT
ncbi:MAG: universal stress protein [Bacteroidota bacterium]